MKSSSIPPFLRASHRPYRPTPALPRLLALVLGLAASAETAHAGSATWSGTTGTWTDSSWLSGATPVAAPGSTSTTNGTDVATFASSGPGTVTVDTGRNVKGITFNGSSAYTLSGGSLVLSTGTAANGYEIQNTSAGTAAQSITSAITLEGAYAFDSSATSASNTLSITGGVSTAATGTLTLQGSNTGSNTVSGLANGTGTLTINKTGTGSWTIAGNNTYTGATVVTTGTLVLTGTLTATSGVTTSSGNVFNETTTGVIGGTGGINFNSTGASSLLGANTFTGSIVLSAGALTINSLSDTVANSLGLGTGSAIGLQTGGTLIYNGASNGSTQRAVTIGNSGGTSGAYSTIENDSASSVLTLKNISSAGSNNATTSDLRLQGTTGGSGTTINNVTGVISEGTGGNILTLTKAGSGTWELSGADTYGGKTTISAGTLMIANAAALGSGGLATGDQGTTVASGAVLDLNGTSNVNETITLNGSGISGAGALVNSSSTAASIKGGVLSGLTLTSAGSGYSSVPAVTLSGGGGAGATATATLGITAASVTVTAGGSGYTNGSTVTISGGGGTGAKATLNVTGGVITGITIVSPGSGYTSTPTFTVTGGTGGSLTGNATNFTVTGLTVTNAGTTAYTSAPTVAIGSGSATAVATLSGVVLASSSSIGGTGDITLAGQVSDGGAGSTLTKVGTNTLFLSGANSYSGGTTITAGAISLSGAGTLGSTSAALVDNSNLNLGATSQTVGTLSGSGNVYNNTAGGSTLTVSGSGTSSFSGVIENNTGSGGTVALTKAGTGILSLTHASGNTYSGGTSITGGKLLVTNTSGSGTGTGSVLVTGSTAVLGGTGKVSGAVYLSSGGSLYSGATAGSTTSGPGPGAVTGTTGGMTLSAALNVNGGALTFALANSATGTFASPALSTSYITTTSTVSFSGSDTINLVDLSNGGLTLRQQNAYLLISASSSSMFSGLVVENSSGVIGLSQDGFEGSVLGVWTGTGDGYTALTFNQYGSDGMTLLAPTNADNTTGAYILPSLYLKNGDLEVVPEPGTWALMLGGLAVLVLWQRRKADHSRR